VAARRSRGLTFSIALGAAVALLSASVVDAQGVSSVRTTRLVNSRSVACVEESGQIHFTLRDEQYALRFVLRFPADRNEWSGRLVIGVHGETGSTVRYGPGGEEIGTHETQLDDMFGRHALDAGHAYASFERGVGGRDDALVILYGFGRVMRERLAAASGREPSHIYLAGWSTGGTLARYAAEDSRPRFDGVVVVAGVGGNPAWTTGLPRVPTIEIVGTGDTAVAQVVRAYRDRLRRGAAGADAPPGASLFRLYEVEGARHVSVDDDDVPSFERGKSAARREQYIGRVSYFAVVQSALDLLNRWVTRKVMPPPDQVVVPPAGIK
jgi:poly(3-hydroxybutyrate) depolymerase